MAGAPPVNSVVNGNATTNDGPRDLFLHLLAIVALYMSVFELLSMLFSFVEIRFPATANDGWSSPLDSIRFAVATLIIAFPVYVWAGRFIVFDVARNPRKITLWTCRCPFYLTIFLAALTSIIDLICLLYYFLEGEMTTPFVLKVAAVLIVTGAAGIYYLMELWQAPPVFPATARRFVYPACALVVGYVIAGFIVSGPPMRKWFAYYDDKQIADLKIVQDRVLDYWRTNKKLPDGYSALLSFNSKVPLPNVPGSQLPYDYELIGSRTFKVCANFRLASQGRGPLRWGEGGGVGWGWTHSAGCYCFQRELDTLPLG